MFIYVRNGNRDFFQYIRLHTFDVSFLVRLGRKQLPQILVKGCTMVIRYYDVVHYKNFYRDHNNIVIPK